MDKTFEIAVSKTSRSGTCWEIVEERDSEALIRRSTIPTQRRVWIDKTDSNAQPLRSASWRN